MKFFVFACFAFAAIVVQASASAEEWMDAINSCLGDVKLTQDDLKKMIHDDDEKTMCIFACANKKLKVFDGTKFDADLLHQKLDEKMNKKNADSYTPELKKEVDNCIETANKLDEDECTKTAVFFGCISEIKGLLHLIEDSDE